MRPRRRQGLSPPLPDQKGTPVDVASGELHAYFGADDNLDSGEHDGSTQVANGPSDGGSIVANITPLSAARWLTKVLGGDQRFLLTHPAAGSRRGARRLRGRLVLQRADTAADRLPVRGQACEGP